MKDRANVKILPPVIPIAALTVGAAAQAIRPIEILPPNIALPTGIAMTLMAIGIVGVAIWQMRCANTAFDVRKTSTNLITSGIFRYSRNPTYLSMIIVCFGIALMVNSLPIFLASFLVGSGLCLLVIQREETYLQEKFGERYLSYRAVVRRWI